MIKRLLWLGLAWSVACQLSAESFTTNVVDGVSTNITTDFILGDTGPYNFLLITNGGKMTNLARSFIGNTVEAHNNTAIVTGKGAVWDLDQMLVLGSHSASNVLAILGGGFLGMSQPLSIGSSATASNNFLHVSGSGSRLATPWLYLGIYGPGNRLLAEDGARLTVPNFVFNSEGGPDGGRQTVVLRGGGTILSTSGSLRMGNSPANTLQVLDGAEVVTGESIIGGLRSAANRVVVSGAGSRWRNFFQVVIGDMLSPSNEVVVSEGGWAQTSRMTIGRDSSDNSCFFQSGANLMSSLITLGQQHGSVRNQFVVTGAGTAISNNSIVTVGEAGSDNSFVLSDQAVAAMVDFYLGQFFPSSNNQAMASGSNTLWIGRVLTIGGAGDFNTLSIDQGAHVFASSLFSGGQGGAGNLNSVSGRGSLLSLTNELALGGNNSTGNSLVVTNEARVESKNAIVGNGGLSNVAVISRASWSNITSFVVGLRATSDNALCVSEIGRLYVSNLVVGSADDADRNRVEISGKGTTVRVLNDFMVGSWGDTNDLIVMQGASVSAGRFHVGAFIPPGVPIPAAFPAHANTAFIHGTNTVVNIASNITLGYDGSSNRLEVRARAQLTSGNAEVGTRRGSAGNTILVSDPGTRWHNTNTFVLGSNGYGSTLIISNGASLRTGPTVLGSTGITLRVSDFCSNQFGFNQAVVVGTGTVWQVDGTLRLGTSSGSNSIVVKHGATLRGADITVGQYGGTCAGEISNLLSVDGGTLEVPGIFIAPRGQFRVLSGRANVGSLWVEVGQPGRVQILGGRLRPGSMYASAPAQIEIGDGIRRATLELIGGTYFSSGRIIVASNSVVAGRGSINTTNAGTYGTFDAITAITNATLQGCSGFDVWISALGPATGHSVLNLVPAFGTPVLSGHLRVALNPSFQPHPTNEFPIAMFTSATGSFVNAPHDSRLKTVDNLGSFLVLYRPNAVVLTDYRTTDTDGDGIEDHWATNHFGHSPLTSAEKAADNDGDGFSNYDEFRAGTDPSDPASALRVSVAMTQGTARLQWPCVDGKTYRIHFSGDVRSWRQVSDPTFAFPQAGLCEWTDDGRDGGPTSGQMRFYRVAVE